MVNNTLINSTNPETPKANSEVNFFAMTNYRNQNRKFGIKLDDRRRHMYVVGKTGMGKTTMLENMVLNDIYTGQGVGLVDPHGDFAEKIINYIPANRINDVIYFNPGDLDYPIGFNILETIDPRHRHLVASGLMGVFKKIWPDVWSSRMEYILNNTILALLDFPGTTLLGINRLLADADYRRRVVRNLKDPVVKAFWQNEFASYNDRYAQEAVAPIQNKIGQFLSASVIRNIVAQVKSRINIREIMDNRKIFIMNLSKGRIGEDNSRLLGGMLITKIQLSAMERVDTPENQRSDFFMYVDEFQNFATESFANILSEARKYRLDLVMAHQYMEQLDEKVLAAVIGNVGTIITFRVGSTDSEILAKEFTPYFVEEDLVNLTKFQVYLKLMIDGVASRPFSATTLPPIGLATDSEDKVIKVSRERYAVPRGKIEDKIMRWSGMEVSDLSHVRPDSEASDDIDLDDSLDHDDLKIPEGPERSERLEKPEKLERRETPEGQEKQGTVRQESEQIKVEPLRPPAPEPQVQPRPTFLTAKPSAGPAVVSRPAQQFQAPFGEGKKRKRKRKKKNRGLPFGAGQPVVNVDASQKGISLSELSDRSKKSNGPTLSLERRGGEPKQSPPKSEPNFDASTLGLIKEQPKPPQKQTPPPPPPAPQNQLRPQSPPQPKTIKPGQVEKIDNE